MRRPNWFLILILLLISDSELKEITIKIKIKIKSSKHSTLHSHQPTSAPPLINTGGFSPV